jgi:hypothetical protein
VGGVTGSGQCPKSTILPIFTILLLKILFAVISTACPLEVLLAAQTLSICIKFSSNCILGREDYRITEYGIFPEKNAMKI